MYRISNFQIYCLLLISVGPIAFLEQPKRLALLIYHNAWLASLAAIIPGIFIVMMFSYLIRKSRNPFPYLLEEYLGKIGGRVLAFIYVLVFLVTAGFTLSLFTNFVEINVLPGTPISVFIVALLFLGYVAIKNGFENFARLCEIIVMVGFPFSIGIVLLAATQNVDMGNLLPLGYMDLTDFGLAVISTTSILGRLFPILTIAYFSNHPSGVHSIMVKVLFSYILLMVLPSLAITLVYGGIASGMLVFPAFSLVRLIDISEFITNVDILFIGIWITGIVGAFTIFWYMACLTMQQVFNLKTYDFLAAPSSLIIAVLSLIIGPNIMVLKIFNQQIIIGIYLLFFLLIPFLLFIMALFKPDKPVDASPNKDTSTLIM